MWGLCLRSHSDSSVSIGLVLTWKLNTSESTEMPSFLAWFCCTPVKNPVQKKMSIKITTVKTKYFLHNKLSKTSGDILECASSSPCKNINSNISLSMKLSSKLTKMFRNFWLIKTCVDSGSCPSIFIYLAGRRNQTTRTPGAGFCWGPPVHGLGVGEGERLIAVWRSSD